MSISVDRLLKLPAVFHYRDLVEDSLLGDDVMRQESAKKFLTRAQSRGYVLSAGPRTGYYYNLLLEPHPTVMHTSQVVNAIYPEAVVIGPSVLHANGLIDHPSEALDIAISERRRSMCQINGVQLHPKAPEWFFIQQRKSNILAGSSSPFKPVCSLTVEAVIDEARKQARESELHTHEHIPLKRSFSSPSPKG